MSSSEYIYGLNPAFEVILANRRKIFRANITDKTSEPGSRTQKLITLLERMRIPVSRPQRKRLSQLCGSNEHQDVVLESELYPYVSSEEIIKSSAVLMLDNIEDPHNAGAILRSAEVFGWHDILMANKGTPGIYPSVVKSSAGATEHLRIAKDRSANDYFKLLMDNGFTVIALDGKGKESIEEIKNLPISKPALIIGGENKSVGQYILNNASHVAAISQRGKIGSLNASVAAGIALFELGKSVSKTYEVDKPTCT